MKDTRWEIGIGTKQEIRVGIRYNNKVMEDPEREIRVDIKWDNKKKRNTG